MYYDAIRDYIVSELMGGDGDGLDRDTGLLALAILDSMSMVGVVKFIEERFGVRVPEEEIRADNFRSLGHIEAMLTRLSA